MYESGVPDVVASGCSGHDDSADCRLTYEAATITCSRIGNIPYKSQSLLNLHQAQAYHLCRDDETKKITAASLGWIFLDRTVMGLVIACRD